MANQKLNAVERQGPNFLSEATQSLSVSRKLKPESRHSKMGCSQLGVLTDKPNACPVTCLLHRLFFRLLPHSLPKEEQWWLVVPQLICWVRGKRCRSIYRTQQGSALKALCIPFALQLECLFHPTDSVQLGTCFLLATSEPNAQGLGWLTLVNQQHVRVTESVHLIKGLFVWVVHKNTKLHYQIVVPFLIYSFFVLQGFVHLSN